MINWNGNIIREERKRQKLTLRDLSSKTGIDYSMLSKYENGLVKPSPAKLKLITEALNISEDMLASRGQALNMPLPIRRRSNVTEVDEDKYVVARTDINEEVLRAANGKCELCGQQFSDGPFFLETHHVVWLRDGGTPTLDNTVALCPNCHKRIHLYNYPEDTMKLLEIAKNHEKCGLNSPHSEEKSIFAVK